MNSADNFFLDKEKLRTIDTLRITYFVIFLFSFGLTELGRFVYRPFIYENNINDFGIADSKGNLGGIIVQIFFGLALVNSTKKKGLRLIGFFMIGYIRGKIGGKPVVPDNHPVFFISKILGAEPECPLIFIDQILGFEILNGLLHTI